MLRWRFRMPSTRRLVPTARSIRAEVEASLVGAHHHARSRPSTVVAAAVTLLLVVSLLSFGSLSPPREASKQAAPGVAPAKVGELPERATATSTTRRNRDGSLTTTVYSSPVNYRDRNGTYQRIDSTLHPINEGGYAWRSGANSFEARFKAALDEGFTEFRVGSRVFRTTAVGAAAARATASGSEVSYPGAYPGADLTYTVGKTGVKEIIHLAGPDSPTSYTFRVSAADKGSPLSVRRRADGSYWVMAPPLPGPAFVLSAPLVREASGPRQLAPPAGEARPTLKVQPVGRDLVVTLSLDEDWLRAPGRSFPVQLDPTITIQPDVEDATFIAQVDDYPWTDERLYIGSDDQYTFRSALQFDLSGVPAGTQVTDAKLGLYFDWWCIDPDGLCMNSDHVMDAHRITAPWSTSAPMNSPRFDTAAAGTYTLAAGAPQGWMTWPITSTVQGWLSGTLPNYGLLVKRRTEVMNSSGPNPPGARFSGAPALQPKLELTYSGDGVDLLEPATLHGNGADLAWSRYSGQSAFVKYEVHRSSSATFTPSAQTLLATIGDQSVTTYRDTTAAPDQTFSYRIVANGSASNPRTVTLPPAGQARKVLQPDSAAGRQTTLNYSTQWTACDNYGIADEGTVGTSTTEKWREVFYFDLSDIPANATITSATASTWQRAGATAAMTLQAHRITRPWTEGTTWAYCSGDGATWYETAGGQAWSTPGGDVDSAIAGTVDVPPGDATGFLNLPITGLVQNWVNGRAPNHGFLLRASDETLRDGNSVLFTTDDYTGTSALRPKLTVTYADGNVVQGPKVSLAAPAPGSAVSGSTVRLAASAEDDRRVDQVEFLVDGSVVGSDTSAPFEITWNSASVSNGTRNLTLRATDDAGNVTTTSTTPVSVTVDNTAPPSGSLTAPAAGATVGGSAVTVSADVSDDVGVTSVAFLVDGVRVGAPDTSSPYSIAWNTLDPLAPGFNGPHEVNAVVTDTSGLQYVTAPRTVTVNNTGTTGLKAGFALNDPATTTDDVMPPAMAENTANGVPAQDPYAGTTNPDGTSGGSLNRALGDAPRDDGGTAPVPLTQAAGSTPCAAAESADKVIDRSVAGSTTKWCSTATDKWVQAQLTSEQTVSTVVLRHAQAGGEPANWNTKDYDIQTSTDGVTWSTALQVRGNTAGTTTHQLTPVRARYVKVVVLVPTQDTNTAARIYELEVYVADRVNPTAATGSTACASTETADKAIDRSTTTKWCSSATSKWLQAQLPTTQTVNTVVVRHAGVNGEPTAWNTRDFDIQTSADGTTWSAALQVRGNTASVSTHQLPSPVAARYVKVTVVTPTQNGDPAARIYELELFNRPVVAAGSAPAPLCPTGAYCPTVTITNTSGSTWTNSSAQVWYRWYAPNGAIMFEGRSGFGFPTSFAANATQAFPLTIYPPALPPGVQQGTYSLRVDVWDPATVTWFSAKGNPPMDNPVIVAKSLATKLGLERYYQYDGEPLGAGMSTMTNIANGNMLARWTPFFSPGRGLSTMADLTYNSLEDHSKNPAGNNFSLSISGLIRLGEPLDIHPNKADEISGKSNKWVEFTDGDGTTHHFDGTTGADGITRWTDPPGVNLYLRSLPDGDSNGKWALTRPDKVTFYFDADGFPLSVQDRNDNRIRFTLEDTPPGEDPGGPKKRITTVTDAGNRSFLIDYWSKDEAKKAHVRGNIQTITDHSGTRLDFDYYDDGNLLRLTQRGGTNADGTFLAPRSFVFTYTTSKGDGPAIGADGATGTAARLNPDAKTPNQSTRLYSVIDPRQAETRFAYYQANEGAQLRWKLKSRTNRANQTTSYGYDLTNRVTTVTAPLARATKFSYDTTGKVTQIVNPKNETTGVQWSADYKVAQVTEPTGKFTTWAYNANGYLTSTTNQTRSETTQLTYTDSAVDANDTGKHLSLLATVTKPKGVATTGDDTDHRWTYSYDSAGNPDRVTDPTGAYVDYDYNLAPSPNRGTVAQVVDANQNPPTVFEAYHASGQPAVIRDPMGKRTRFGYNDDGQVVWIQDPNHENDTGSDERAYKTFFDYDSFGRLGRQSAPKSTSAERGTLLWSGVEFDPNDNVTRDMDAHYGSVTGGDPRTGAVTTTTYDAMDRPTLSTGPDTSADPAGERTRIDYDAAGRTEKVTKPKGVASAVTDDYTTVYGYDPLDRIVKQTAYGTSTGQVRVTQ
ncbi:MAG TPA: DNRLRE domain-containing protein, partial [Jiangellales bacterium]|nr:DNRLRE domain-containing protein [Jiangellales bacterium]